MNNFVLRKYKEFYEKNGYIPRMFNPYNTTEITDVAPCLSTQCGSTTSSATVLIIEMEEQKQMKYQVIRHWNGSKGFGKKFNTREEAEEYLRTDEKVQEYECEGFYFSVVEVQE